MQNGTTILEEGLAVSYKVRHVLTTQPNKPTPRYVYLRKMKLLFTQKPVCKRLRQLYL